jgi:hypothetical protein
MLVLNEPRQEIRVCCDPKRVWAVLQEPNVPGFFPWMREGHAPFARVYTSEPPAKNSRYVAAPPFVPWQVDKTFDQLVAELPPPKESKLSWVTSNLQGLPGHKKRFAFYQYLKELGWNDFEVYGRGIRAVADKWEVLQPCSYAIAIENHGASHYWTEKVADCWLAYSLPFYYGCLNLEEYFPREAFIRIDLDDFSKAASTIRKAMDANEYERRLPAIVDAREKLLQQYQFFPFFSKEIKRFAELNNICEKQDIRIQPYRQGSISKLRDHLYLKLS